MLFCTHAGYQKSFNTGPHKLAFYQPPITDVHSLIDRNVVHELHRCDHTTVRLCISSDSDCQMESTKTSDSEETESDDEERNTVDVNLLPFLQDKLLIE